MVMGDGLCSFKWSMYLNNVFVSHSVVLLLSVNPVEVPMFTISILVLIIPLTWSCFCSQHSAGTHSKKARLHSAESKSGFETRFFS